MCSRLWKRSDSFVQEFASRIWANTCTSWAHLSISVRWALFRNFVWEIEYTRSRLSNIISSVLRAATGSQSPIWCGLLLYSVYHKRDNRGGGGEEEEVPYATTTPCVEALTNSFEQFNCADFWPLSI